MGNKKPNGYWYNYDKCKAEAAKYSSRSEFHRGNAGAYKASLRFNWIDDFDSVYKPKEKKIDNAPRAIYAYIDKENNWVYVGLTKDVNNRDKGHRRGIKKKGIIIYDTVWKHFNEVGKPIPKPKVLMIELTAQEARYHEDWYRRAYKRAGWTTGNKAKTGEFCSSLGGGNIVWTYEKSRDIASKCKNIIEFKKKNCSAYASAYNNGWLGDWFNKYKWNYESCKELAETCSSRNEFREKYAGAYAFSARKGLLNDFFGERTQKPPKYWTYERCKEEAAKYSSRGEFQKGNAGAHTASLRNGWLDDWFKKPFRWTFNSCRTEALKYKSRGLFKKNNPAAYKAARLHGWLNDFYPSAA